MCKCEGQDREVDARATQADVADDEGKDTCDHNRHNHSRDHVRCEQLHHPDRGVGADTEECGVSEAEVACQAEQDVKPDCEDPEDHETLHQVGIARIELGEARAFREGVKDERCEHCKARHDQ